jgi:hypothetical protein
VHALFAWIEATGLGQFMRHSGPWTYAFVNLAHVIGVATLFGSVLVLDLRLLGMWRSVPLGPLSRIAVPVAASGLAIAIPTGAALLATKATAYEGNVFLLIKFPAIALGLVNLTLAHWSAAWNSRDSGDPSQADRRRLALFGGVSLASWLTAIAMGRLIAYW